MYAWDAVPRSMLRLQVVIVWLGTDGRVHTVEERPTVQEGSMVMVRNESISTSRPEGWRGVEIVVNVSMFA
jgi:hypothetical protein